MTGHTIHPPLTGETVTEQRRRAQAVGAERRAAGEQVLHTWVAQLYRAYGGPSVPSTNREGEP